MCDRLQRGEYGQQSELALIACKYNLEIIVFENGTLIIYPPLHQKIRTEPGNQKKILAAVRFFRINGKIDSLVTLMISVKQ